MDRQTLNPSWSRGIALLMVITVLVTLVLIAVPFAISMRQGRERTTSELAKGRADFEAELLTEAMKHYLGNTHPKLERDRWLGGERAIESDPTVDSLQEITIGEDFRRQLRDSWSKALDSDTVQGGDPRLLAHMQALESSGLGLMNDDRGSIWTGVAEDANGKVNANGVSPFLLGNLLGCALLSEDLDPSSPTISVEHEAGSVAPRLGSFPRAGGFIRIGGEVIRYSSFDGSTFRQCERGSLPMTPLKDNGSAQSHEQGTPVIDYAAYKIATHMIAARPKFLTPFRNLEDLRSVAGWGGGPGLPADRLDRVREFLTVWSRRETASGWLASQVVVNQLPVSTDPTTPDEVEIRDQLNPTGSTAYLNVGTIVRITDGNHTVYQAVARVGDSTGGQIERMVTLAGRVDAGYEDSSLSMEGGETKMAAWAPYPININTAAREVLFACMANLHVEGADSDETIVTPALAMTLADLIVDERSRPLSVDQDTNRRETGPFRHIEDYGRFLERLEEEGAISQMQQGALYRNAVNPHDHQLAFGTTTWCFRTLDVYHLEARVAVNSRGGEQLATAFRSEVVQIGPDESASWVLDSQNDFEERLSMGHGAKWMATHPIGVNFRSESTAHIQPAPRARKALMFKAYPSAARSGEAGGSESDQRGEVRLEPARVKFQLPGATVRNHFDSSLFTEGWRTDFSGAFTHKTAGAFIGEDEDYASSFSLSFWWNAFSESNWTAFDCGMDQFQNRYAIFVTDGQEGPELVFRVCATPLEKRGAEVYVPLERIGFAPDTWYHIHVSCGGEDATLMEMFIDGVSIGKRRGVTWLDGGVTEDQQEIQVEDTIGFADVGALLIGSEVVEYERREGEGFSACLRGARGTGPQAWPTGTPVRELGYSNTIMVDVMTGGGRIPDVLGYWTAARIQIEPNGTDMAIEKFTDDGGTEDPIDDLVYEFHGVAPGVEEFDAELVPLWENSVEEMGEAFQSKGIALMGCPKAADARSENADLPRGALRGETTDVLLHGWELVYYERDDINSPSIRIVKRHLESWERPEWPDPENDGEPHFVPFWVVEENNSPPTPELNEFPAFLVPLSIVATGSTVAGDDYLDPNQEADQEILARYFGDRNSADRAYVPAYIAIGLPRGDGDEAEDVEPIQYDRIDREVGSPELLFVRDRDLTTLTEAFFSKSDSDQVPPPPQDDEEEELLEDGELVEEPVPEDVPEDVSPPKDVEIPLEDPIVDASGGGDNERAGEEIEYPEEIIKALDGYPSPRDWGATSQFYGEPEWGAVAPFIRATFRGLVQGPDGEIRDWRHYPGQDAERDDLILPCFCVNEWGRPIWGGRPAGRNDRVTFVTGAEDTVQRESARIRWAAPNSGWVALDEFITRRFAADKEEADLYKPDLRGMTRMLKFPSGELPDELPVDMEFSRSVVSNSEVVNSILDELNIWTHRKGAYLHLEPDSSDSEEVYGIQPTDTDIRLIARHRSQISDIEGFDQDCGLLDLDGELIVWRGATWEQHENGTYQVLVLERCERGVLGTVPRFHGEGAYGRLVPHFPVSYLDGRANRDASSLPLGRTRGWPREGLARVVGGAQAELIHYTRLAERTLLLPESMDANVKDRGRGLLRGRFGTDVMDHEGDALVFWQPFRYWDRYMARRTEDNQSFAGVHDHPQASYLEIGKRVRSGVWHRVTWSQGPYEALGGAPGGRGGGSGRGGATGGDASGLLDVVVIARFSPNVPWDSERIIDLRSQSDFTSRGAATDERPSDAIYVFDDPNATNSLGLEAETAECRVFFVYRPGAFLAQDLLTDSSGVDDLIFENSWKRTPTLLDFTLEYHSRTSTLSRSMRE